MIIKLPLLPFNIKVHRVYPGKKELQKEKPWAVIKNRNFDKVFCIGAGKTGTTSLEKLFTQFGFKMGNQPTAEVLSRDWLMNTSAERIIRYCYTADAFQDAPFGYPNLYNELDKAFPNSKFILTVRNSAEEWFNSLVRFHAKKFSSDPLRPPNDQDLSNATYRYKGYMFESYQFVYGKYNIPLYDKQSYKENYLKNNEEKRNYFKNRPNDFIEINLSIQDDFQRLCEFLNIETNIAGFPWENKTQPSQPQP